MTTNNKKTEKELKSFLFYEDKKTRKSLKLNNSWYCLGLELKGK
ncbi:MAG: hypothetical protein AABY22_14635 [Nanoarchaeota archaeon]|mgnify:CR=1 FL=1